MLRINKNNIALAVIMSVITFGLYNIYWMYLLVKNTYIIQQKSKRCFGEMLLLIFTPYVFYWWYTRGELVKNIFKEQGRKSKCDGVLFLILSILGFSIVAEALMQSDFNSIDKKTVNRTLQTTQIGFLTALSVILYAIEIPVGPLVPTTPFLKIDFSDVPAFIAMLGIHPIAGFIVMLAKNVLHFLLLTKEPAFSGEMGNLLAGLCMMLPAYLFLQKKQGSFQCIAATIMASLYSAIAMVLFNYFITLPMYGIYDSALKEEMILFGFLPFNLIKGASITIISIIVFKMLEKTKIFHKNRNAI